MFDLEKLFFEKRLLKKRERQPINFCGEKEHSLVIKADREEGLSGLSRLYIFSKAVLGRIDADLAIRIVPNVNFVVLFKLHKIISASSRFLRFFHDCCIKKKNAMLRC